MFRGVDCGCGCDAHLNVAAGFLSLAPVSTRTQPETPGPANVLMKHDKSRDVKQVQHGRSAWFVTNFPVLANLTARFTTPTGPDSPHQVVEPDSPHQLVGPDSPHRLVRPDLPHQLVSTRIGQCSSAVLIASAHKANAKPERVRGFCASAHFFPKSSESKKLARLVFSTRFDQRIRRIPSSRLSTRTPV